MSGLLCDKLRSCFRVLPYRLGLVVGSLLFASHVVFADLPSWPRLSIVEDPARSMTLAWTLPTTDPSFVELGPEGSFQAAFPAWSEDTGSPVLGVTHGATLSDLLPDTRYQYRICSADACTRTHVFQTLPDDPKAPLCFAVMGDSRAARPFLGSGLSSAPGYAEVLQAAMDAGARFVLHTGDMVGDGNREKQWPDHLNHEQPVAASIPILYALGNHDDGPGEGNTQWFNKLYVYPPNPETNTEDFYTFTAQEARFVVLTPYSYEADHFGVQTRFLRQTLALRDKPWNFVMLHTPLHTCPLRIAGSATGHKADESGAGVFWEPEMVKAGVDMVFSGHNHIYELFGPQDPALPYASLPDGPLHLTAGGAAKGDAFMLGKTDDDCPGRLAASDHFHFVLVTLHDGLLRVEYVDMGDRFGDSAPSAPRVEMELFKERGDSSSP